VLILNATNTLQVALTVVAVVPAYKLATVVHVPAVGAVSIVLRGTQPEAEVDDNEETAIGKAVIVRASFIAAASIPTALQT